MSEFKLIQQHFSRQTKHTDLGVGDDAALITVQHGNQLVISTDMSVVGTHFFANAAPYDIGWKSLAVNISDMAAMAASPKWATLAIALPEQNEHWLSEFSRGFFACAEKFGVDLIGGDTTKGTLNISVTIFGEVPTGTALRRNSAQIGDDIWVSGTLGDAALALAVLQNRYAIDKNWPENELEKWLPCLNRPQPRVALGLSLRGLATSCIDISDGLLADLGHILVASNLGATITVEQLPMSLYNFNHQDQPEILQCVLAGGDDYELCFTAPKSARDSIIALSKELNLLITCIGVTHQKPALPNKNQPDLTVLKCQKPLKIKYKGFDHFA